MQPFTCPQCGHESEFDPRTAAAVCSDCGFTPPTEGPRVSYLRWAQRDSHRLLLDELLAHWRGCHEPETGFDLSSPSDAAVFFRGYQRALGEDPHLSRYARGYHPSAQEIVSFAGALACLRRGDSAGAADELRSLTLTSPAFVDPWIWLTATTGDAAQRQAWLAHAVQLDGDHPLAREALAAARPEAPASEAQEKEPVAHCPYCGGGLPAQWTGTELACPHCGQTVDCLQVEVGGAGARDRARPAPTLLRHQLRPRHEGQPWQEAQRVVRCQVCGAGLTPLDHPIRHCVFCGSTEMALEPQTVELERPVALLPFRLAAGDAVGAISWEGRLSWSGLKALWTGRGQKLVELEAVYLPFWAFDGLVETYRAGGESGRPARESLGWDTFEQLLIPAVASPAQVLLEALHPFDLAALVPYEPRFLAAQPARLPDRQLEQVAGAARNAMLARARDRFSRRLGRARAGIDCQVLGLSYRLVLLPVWLGRVAAEDAQRQVVVNGESGRVAFDPVVSDAQFDVLRR